MAQYAGVSFKRHGQIYFFTTTPFVLNMRDRVLVKTEEGIGFGEVMSLRDTLPEGLDAGTLKPIYRPATQEDLDIWRENQELARESKKFCQQCVSRFGLDMKLVDVEIYFDKSKMIFYFTAPGRVDFRELVKDLVRAYRTRIELRQIGVRHETQMIGALGGCGEICCCRRYLRNFAPVTIKMAKDQNLFLNPAKISGVCGRLLCCLAYEKDNYADFQNRAPRIGRKYMTTRGVMKTLRANMFRDSVSVMNEAGEELDFSLDDWNSMLSPDQPRMAGHGDAGGEIPAGLAALADPEPHAAKHPRRASRSQQNRPPRHEGGRQDAGRKRPERTERNEPRPRPQSQEARPPRSSSRPESEERREPRRRDRRRKPGPPRDGGQSPAPAE
ncbi:MAG: regulatory iron-sulfur-containing complex subunit RicT [Pseudomonadota bacterium]|nr:regulatory iron-sulfur-containing complex subunit RicT [Pseudomonadota bacterium]